MQSLALALCFLTPILASPPSQLVARRPISDSEDVLLFDGFGFEQAGEQFISQQAYVYGRQLDHSGLLDVLELLLKPFGLDDEASNAAERLRLFASLGVEGIELDLAVDGSAETLDLPPTSGLPDLGLVAANLSVESSSSLGSKVQTRLVGTSTTASAYISPAEGFGVLSDIDDTVKVSNVLDTFSTIRKTLFEEPEAVAGMPELYASLASSLASPQFIYLTGSPYQLYPFLHEFINDRFSASAGPINTRNLTLLDIAGLFSLLFDDNNTLEYKVGAIDSIHAMYPGNKFLAIGDSTQQDPEAYATSYRKYGDFIACIWIRLVEDADNSDERFQAAFEGVPASKTRVFSDAEIGNLQNVDVAGGQC